MSPNIKTHMQYNQLQWKFVYFISAMCFYCIQLILIRSWFVEFIDKFGESRYSFFVESVDFFFLKPILLFVLPLYRSLSSV